MLNLIANVLEGLGSIVANVGTSACIMWYVDEPECPKSLIK